MLKKWKETGDAKYADELSRREQDRKDVEPATMTTRRKTEFDRDGLLWVAVGRDDDGEKFAFTWRSLKRAPLGGAPSVSVLVAYLADSR